MNEAESERERSGDFQRGGNARALAPGMAKSLDATVERPSKSIIELTARGVIERVACDVQAAHRFVALGERLREATPDLPLSHRR